MWVRAESSRRGIASPELRSCEIADSLVDTSTYVCLRVPTPRASRSSSRRPFHFAPPVPYPHPHTCTSSSCMPRNCSSSSCCWTLVRPGLNAPQVPPRCPASSRRRASSCSCASSYTPPTVATSNHAPRAVAPTPDAAPLACAKSSSCTPHPPSAAAPPLRSALRAASTWIAPKPSRPAPAGPRAPTPASLWRRSASGSPAP
jgi:hypothetical protein